MWTKNEECRRIIQDIWGSGTTNSNLEEVRRKSQAVGKALVSLNWSKFGHVQHRIKSLKEELALILASNNQNGSPEREEILSKEGVCSFDASKMDMPVLFLFDKLIDAVGHPWGYAVVHLLLVFVVFGSASQVLSRCWCSGVFC
ncbi:hypothetical protein U1Q18_028785, partial [Sarracenia purpurea var. burkii]